MSIQAVSGMAPGAAAISGVKAAPAVRRAEDVSPARAPAPARDEYVPEEKRAPAGQYWPGRGEDGQPKIFFDDPEKPAGEQAERCTADTGAVDREIEQLKKEQAQLARQLSRETDEGRREALAQKLAQVEQALAQKDNDAYRRQHTVFS